jgi:hypothetical protein
MPAIATLLDRRRSLAARRASPRDRLDQLWLPRSPSLENVIGMSERNAAGSNDPPSRPPLARRESLAAGPPEVSAVEQLFASTSF